MKGIDTSNQITAEIAQELINQGIFYVARYLVPNDPSLIWKRFTKEEAKIMTEYDIKMLTVFEVDENDTKNGRESGLINGSLAYKEAKELVQPKGTPIFFTVDYPAGNKDFDSIEAYLKAAAEQLPGYKVGVYGSYFVTEEMAKREACDYFWQTSAWSENNLSEIGRDVYQYQFNVKIAGIDTDLNDFYTDNVCWNYNTPNEVKEDPQMEEITTLEEALKTLKENGIDIDVEYWTIAGNYIKWFEELMIKIAKGI